MKNSFDYSWQVSKKISKKSKKFKIIFYIFLWGFFIFSSLVSADYYFFYQENKKYFSDQKAGFELIGENLKNNLNQKNFPELEKNFGDLEKKFSEFEKNFLEKTFDKKFLIGSEKIFFEGKNIFNDGIILGKNFLEIEKNFKQILGKNSKDIDLSRLDKKQNPVENILKLNEENLSVLAPGGILRNLFVESFLYKNFYSEPPGAILFFKEINKNKEFISQVLGKNSPQTSVVFFQNSNESRVTGGFVGSFLVFTANSGKILDWKIHDIYGFDGQLKGNFEKIPFEAKTLIGKEDWSLRDFNVNPDLGISSKNFNYFFEKSGGKTVDNFFYLDSKILGEILKITGPIKLENLGLSVDSSNWDFVFQYFVESKKDFQKIGISPKKLMIGELFLSLKNKILPVGTAGPQSLQFEKFLELKNKILEKKYLKFYSKNLEINNLFEENFINKDENFLEKNNDFKKYFISISGNKSDKFIENKWVNWKENDSEKIISVKRKFFDSKEEKEDFRDFFIFLYEKFGSDIPKDELKRILGFGENNSILQFYTESDLDLLFVKYIGDGSDEKINLDFKKWKQGEKNVFEISLPILKNLEKQEIFFNWKVGQKNKY